jgi:hypothetical protein
MKVTKSIDFALFVVRVCYYPSFLRRFNLKITQMIIEKMMKYLYKFILGMVIGVAFVEKGKPKLLTISKRELYD